MHWRIKPASSPSNQNSPHLASLGKNRWMDCVRTSNPFAFPNRATRMTSFFSSNFVPADLHWHWSVPTSLPGGGDELAYYTYMAVANPINLIAVTRCNSVLPSRSKSHGSSEYFLLAQKYPQPQYKKCNFIQRSPWFCAPGLARFVPAVARLFCLALPGSFLTVCLRRIKETSIHLLKTFFLYCIAGVCYDFQNQLPMLPPKNFSSSM